MNSNEIARLQDEAEQAYNRVPQNEAAPWLAALAQLEVAKQLQGINEQIEQIASSLDKIQDHGLTVEKKY